MVQITVPASQGLLIIGAGVLGCGVGERWRAAGGGEVLAVTRTAKPERDASLRALGLTPRVRDALGADDRHAYVVFCASPGGNDDYAGEVAGALQLWDGAGRFVFTSSAGVYAEDGGGRVAEDAPVGDSPRAAKLLRAEEAVRAAGGTVVRLAGLYTLERGAHNAWFNMGEVKQRPDGLINQVHYDDAASCVVAALANGAAGATYLAADDAPLSREAICRAAARAPRFAGKPMPRFVGEGGGTGKVLDSARTRRELGWAPARATFDAFIDAGGE